MRRLLWEEWHEIRWYVLALIVGPWLLSLFPAVDFGYGLALRIQGWQSWECQVLALVLIVWGATRMPREFSVDAMSARWLPVGPWTVWAARIIPGLIVASALPFWVRFIAHTRVHPFNVDGAAVQTCESLAFFVSGYTLAFVIGLLASSAVAVIASWIGLLAIPQAMPDKLSRIMAAYTRPGYIHGYGYTLALVDIAVAALIVSAVVWGLGRNRGIRVRWRQAALTAPLPMVVILYLALAYAMVQEYEQMGRRFRGMGESPAWAFCGDWSSTFALIRHPGVVVKEYFGDDESARIPWSSYVPPLVARDAVAYAFDSATWERPNETRVRTRSRLRTAVKAKFTVPLAWLPDGNLLVGASDTGRSEELLVWDRRTGGTTALGGFPASADKKTRAPITCAAPSPDGSRIALLVLPHRGDDADLWVLDRTTRERRLVYPGLSVYHRVGMDSREQVRWRGDTILFLRSGQEIWSAQSDGSRPAVAVEPSEGG